MMKKNSTPSFISLVLIITILLTPIINGKTVNVSERNSIVSPESEFENSYYIEDLSRFAEEGKIRFTAGLEIETEKFESVLALSVKDKKGTIVVDKYGSKRLAATDF